MTSYSDTETNTYYYLTDHLGSVLAITDEQGDVVEQYRYDAWGRVTVFDEVGTPLTESAIGNRYTFQGREYSWATGFYYFRLVWTLSISSMRMLYLDKDMLRRSRDLVPTGDTIHSE